MKKSISLLTILSFAFLFLGTGCQKNKTGDLIVNVVDGLGASVGEGQTVYLYNNSADYQDQVYSKTATTNSSGQVVFTKLTPGLYYVDCDWQNLIGTTITSSGSGEVIKKMETTITIAP